MRGIYAGTVNFILKNILLKFKELGSKRTNSVFWQNDARKPKYRALVIPDPRARHKWANVAKFVKVYEANIHKGAKSTEARALTAIGNPIVTLIVTNCQRRLPGADAANPAPSGLAQLAHTC